MSLRTLPRAELSAYLGYLDDEGNPSDRATADLLRGPLNRWGLSPKRAVLEYARAELRACGIEDVSGVPRILQRLVELGECDSVYVGHEPYLAPATPRWIPVGGDLAVYLGAGEPPGDLTVTDRSHLDIVRRVRVDADENVTTLALAGAQETSLAEWLMPLHYVRHVSRRMRQPVRSDKVSLIRFWELLETECTAEGLSLASDARVRVVGGRPGGYFGRYYSVEPEGRWTSEPEEGMWCGYRQGYGEAHWHPCIISIAGHDRRMLDLYDKDEWRWALLARGRCTGAEETVRSEREAVRLDFPAPNQLRAAMDILGKRSGSWAWEVNPGGPSLWQLLN